MMDNIKIENIIATCNIAKELDLTQLSEMIQGSQYDPNEFPGLVIKYSEPRKIAALLFSDGKVVCTGAINEDEIKEIIEKIKKEINLETTTQKDNLELSIQNIVASLKLNKNLVLADVLKILPSENIEYNPDEFPGIVYRLNEKSIVVLIFNSGKLVCVGAKTLEEITKAFDSIKEMLTLL
jgi:transcription initiation factor TFIID TATA-box-binding protein